MGKGQLSQTTKAEDVIGLSLACAQYCLPTDAPHLAKQSRAVAAALSPMVWAQHKPDRFDSFSAGGLSAPIGPEIGPKGP